ncbi:Uma2 family endonuclease [Stratiformator vulcanicus]|uniref:Putative restriction endonuclease domain-containing protein n=1 Tax=Stratiformator vulcanicus TaxID=2527980 RepID=A0A517QY49_9PLAN|nr:Uma2 family endonuclease [Stratiformator vulcanicus]QDT36480.1 hypothetical protein Pan189_08370 [Stratiformator vulcanicus]
MSVTVATEPVLHLGPEDNGALMSPAEFDAIESAEEHYRYELIHGVLVVSPPPGEWHREHIDRLGQLLRNYQDVHPDGAALDRTLPENYVIVGDDRRVCDRAIWAGLGRQPDVVNDIPTIAIEIVSKGSAHRRRDFVEKAREYPAAGVKEYWIIERFAQTMTVIFADGKQRVLKENEVYQTPLLPGFEFALEDVFHDIT